MERLQEALYEFPGRHPAVTAALLWAGGLASFGVFANPGGGDPSLLFAMAGALLTLAGFGLVAKHLIEFEWKQKTAQLERRVEELEGQRSRHAPPG